MLKEKLFGICFNTSLNKSKTFNWVSVLRECLQLFGFQHLQSRSTYEVEYRAGDCCYPLNVL